MTKYSQEKKDYALSLMSPPNNMTVAQVSKRTGNALYGLSHQIAGRHHFSGQQDFC